MTSQTSAKPAHASILAITGGSSSIKVVLFEAGDSLRRILEGAMDLAEKVKKEN